MISQMYLMYHNELGTLYIVFVYSIKWLIACNTNEDKYCLEVVKVSFGYI